MTIKQFIEKAIEGGWKPALLKANPKADVKELIETEQLYSELDLYKALLDPLAWQAVARVTGNGLTADMPRRWATLQMVGMAQALAEGKSLEEFIKTL